MTNYQRAQQLDKRIKNGDDFAGDAYVRWVAVGHTPDDAEMDLLHAENVTLRNALVVHVKHTEQTIKDIGGCDHSVGICCCDMILDIENARAILAPRS